jgi:hypothetical protein
LFFAAIGEAQTPAPADPAQGQGTPPTAGQWRIANDGPGQPLLGKITAINKGALELAKMDGTRVSVKLTDKTEYHKDRQSAKLSDFKVGDMVFVRGDENADHSVNAQIIRGRSGSGAIGMVTGGPTAAGLGIVGGGEMGKDFVVGEVKSIDAPQITIQRPDNVTQKLELTEETSLRKGRDSVTMADIQPGDHVFVRGAMQNNVFVPKSVVVIPDELWKRIQDMGTVMGGSKSPGDSRPNPQQP